MIRGAAFVAATLMYVWAAVESFGVLDGRRFGWCFYTPKLGVLALLVGLQLLARAAYKVHLNRMPLASVASMFLLYSSVQRQWFVPGVALTSSLTYAEVVVLLWLGRRVLLTKAVLHSTEGLGHQTRQIGFHFLLCHATTCFIVYWACVMVFLLAMPTGTARQARAFDDTSYFEVPCAVVGPNMLFLVCATIQAHVHLPSDAMSVHG